MARLRFGDFVLDTEERLVYRSGEAMSLPPKAVDLLIALAEEPGRLRTKEELLQRVWSDVVVDESNLTQTIFLLRKALDDDGNRWIATVPRRGYRFVGTVSAALEAPRARSKWPFVAAGIALLAAVAIVILTRRPAPQSDRIRSIAVLPFRALDEKRRDPPLELGIADTLINKLSRIHDTTVAPVRAVARYVNEPADPRTAGRDLGVDAVVDGNIQREGSRFRATVRLLRVSDGTAVWADEYDASVADVFALEDQIAERVASAIGARLSRSQRQELLRRYTQDREAYVLYQQGLYQWSTFRSEGLVASIRYYEAALQKDPRYALAWTGLAKTYSVMGIYGPMQRAEAFEKSRQTALRALSIDPDLADAMGAHASVKLFWDWQFAEAKQELEQAVAVDPQSEDAHSLLGYTYWALGRADDAVVQEKKEIDLDPTWDVAQRDYLRALYYARRYDEVLPLLRRVHSLAPDEPNAAALLAATLIEKGNAAEVEDVLRGIPAAGNGRVSAMRGVAAARLGHRDQALREVQAVNADPGWVPFNAALIYASLGDRDHAFEQLDAAYRDRFPFIWQARVEPLFDPIRNDQRFDALLVRLKLK